MSPTGDLHESPAHCVLRRLHECLAVPRRLWHGPHGSDVDGVFLSCTNTTQIEAIADIERRLGKPVVNSNQAVLWGCLRKLGAALTFGPIPV